MTTKHRAEVLAETLETVEVAIGADYIFIDEASTLLRTIPVLAAEIEKLKSELKMAQYTVAAWQKFKTDLEEFIK